ncbi:MULTISPECIES: transcription-repair coupling factor [unclassified Fusibacter]|uniref:transcription-repair coupling factor n=1 Tax=unclassified Fusibacter TaxID=2624464 RepID=UPI00101097E8|nr:MULTISPECIES: transcription-repair coupling factor [unclassified Fusibacter]MCK8059521.1 transcription-repair coupling factor [Fusibacter sp. A2]NPE21015.1 transcription-repair coupling factor [Fusibacter sp. A1]RXV62289.1 transcription-repair coupling factor [Fusibacter sp. A1]
MFKHFFKNSVEFNTLTENIRSGVTPTAVFGVTESAFLFNVIALVKEHRRAVVVLENESDVLKAKEVLEPFIETIHTLPRLELTFFDTYSHSHQIEYERLESIYALLEDEDALILTTADAMLHPMVSDKLYKTSPFSLEMGDEMELEELIRELVSFGFDRVDVVESKGQFCVRGGIVDVYLPRYSHPHRIEFFGDEIDSVRAFEIDTQISTGNVDKVVVRPCREGLLSTRERTSAVERVKKLASGCKVPEQKSRYELIVEQLESGTHFDEWFKLIPVMLKTPFSIFDYIDDTLLITWSFNRLSDRVKGKYEDWEDRFKSHLERGEVVGEQGNLLLPFSEWLNGCQISRLVTFTGLKTPVGHLKLQSIIDYHFREAAVYHQQLELAAKDIKVWIAKHYRIWIMVEGAEKAQGILRWLSDQGLEGVENKDDIQEDDQRVRIIDKGFTSGFSIDTFKQIVLTEYELYGGKQLKRRKPIKNARAIKAFSELEISDFVVHEAHGIGQYQGVFQLKVDGQKKDFLKITYKGDDVLYVPVEKMNTLQKYLGNEIKHVRMSKLGSNEWKQTKQKVKKAIEDMTDDLIALYAERDSRKGYAFAGDSEWQMQFEDSFPYQETNDQLKCIIEIKKDMEKPKPMDRLLCGDVGYGKTEVAMRAIFKAVNDSKQVAILVPTTILAQQHFNTMIHRFSKYPVKIGVLSRFRSKREQEEVIEGLRTGVYDVVVGTHRLLSKDVKYKDLGLLVIDEEQRFGVKHKEKIKLIRSTVDVLSLSATPIPRTLHMSLVGIRDMSLIEDPPEDRYPIQTYVLDYQEGALREAILREMDRGGQVYFVHNRVNDIDDVTSSLIRLVPEARIAYAHGQMNEHVLEKLMLDFMNHEFDVLVSTTIIETGLDISNVNTIIINRADHLGLSQLYQLRGRVGRSNRLAYAYLTYDKQKVLSEVAEKRLKAIKEFTDLGSGFKIAMRDLELRGAGNLLGSQQHGHLASIGYELYCKLLEEAVSKVKGEKVEESIDTSVEVPCEAYIPKFYITDSRFKIDLYKKISSIRHKEDKENIEDELFDLYGKIPTSVMNLILVGYIRSMAMLLGFEKVAQKERFVELVYSQNTKVNPQLISIVLDAYNDKELKFVGAEIPRFDIGLIKIKDDPTKVLNRTVQILETFIDALDEIKAQNAQS